MKTAGYEYVNIDNCWMTHQRDADGRLVPDPVKFPDDIKGTVDDVHSLGLKLGVDPPCTEADHPLPGRRPGCAWLAM